MYTTFKNAQRQPETSQRIHTVRCIDNSDRDGPRKNEETSGRASTKTATDTAMTELAEAKAQSETTLIAMQEELDGARMVIDEAHQKLRVLKETSTKQT